MKSLKKMAVWITCVSALGAVAGCDIPTDSPKLEQEWILPITGTSIEVGEFLPDDVELNEDSSAFVVRIDPVVFDETLGALCSACSNLDGLTVPKPAFSGSFNESVSLPEDVESAQIQDGRVVVQARNRFSFDPLRPPGGERGSVTLAIRDGGPDGPILDEVIINGEDTSFGPNSTISRELEYSGPVGSSIAVTIEVTSPAGGAQPGNWVLISLDDQIQVTATTESMEAASARIDVAGEVFDLLDTDLNVEDIGKDMVDKIQSGTLVMDLVNPWSVGAVMNLTIDGPTMAAPVVLIAPVPAAPTSRVTVEISQAELRSFLGEPGVVMTGTGAVDQNAGSVTLAPGQIMTIDARLDLVILIG